jgi:hypothetical protein
MLEIGNLVFGTKSELIDSLFQPVGGQTLDGIYEKRKNGIALNRPDGEPWMFIIVKNCGERFFVSAERLDNGRTRYFNGLTIEDENRLGLLFGEQLLCAHDTWETLCAREARGVMN